MAWQNPCHAMPFPPVMSLPVLEATGLHKRYHLPHKIVDVLNGADLFVQPGERVAIVGRSGAGKSTLLHVLGGLDRPGKGSVKLNGTSVYDLSSRRRSILRARSIGFVFQSYHLLPEMDLIENVMLPAMATGHMPRRTMRARAQDLLKLVGLADRVTHTPLELSGGEQQRAAIARALMNEPKLLLADEPTGNLDRSTGLEALHMLFSIARESGHALVVVTHSQEVAAVCDRTVRLANGLLANEPA